MPIIIITKAVPRSGWRKTINAGININKSDFKISQSLENNKKLRKFFIDFRFKKINDDSKENKQNWILKKLFSVISRKGYIYRTYENFKINKYLDKICN